jgi:catechol 2,3-dioxygenase-like lactoylglutathione lyase family enzyme
MKLEAVVIPVSDVDRAKRFYGSLGWRLDADVVRGDEFRGWLTENKIDRVETNAIYAIGTQRS